ncbi:MAG: hypothetical protein OYG31_03220 [Candidatus Kaiserbacteria bacterium]|nr:hypothetical protein [Candidatus Kaiserbacteria bacterium]
MLYVFYGDRYAARELSRQYVAVCKKKRPHAEYLSISPLSASRSLEELLFGQGLFEKKYIVFCDEVLGDKTCSGHLQQNLEQYHQSPHMFIIFEPSLKPTEEKKLSRAGATMQKSEERQKQHDHRRLFSFTDTFLKRDVGKTFAALHQLLRDGEPADSLTQILLWQLRTLCATDRSDNAEDAGLKPFVYQKAKRSLTALKEDPYDLFLHAEQVVRSGRLAGLSDEEIIEYVVLETG